jgi:hypothetical protein
MGIALLFIKPLRAVKRGLMRVTKMLTVFPIEFTMDMSLMHLVIQYEGRENSLK